MSEKQTKGLETRYSTQTKKNYTAAEINGLAQLKALADIKSGEHPLWVGVDEFMRVMPLCYVESDKRYFDLDEREGKIELTYRKWGMPSIKICRTLKGFSITGKPTFPIEIEPMAHEYKTFFGYGYKSRKRISIDLFEFDLKKMEMDNMPERCYYKVNLERIDHPDDHLSVKNRQDIRDKKVIEETMYVNGKFEGKKIDESVLVAPFYYSAKSGDLAEKFGYIDLRIMLFRAIGTFDSAMIYAVDTQIKKIEKDKEKEIGCDEVFDMFEKEVHSKDIKSAIKKSVIEDGKLKIMELYSDPYFGYLYRPIEIDYKKIKNSFDKEVQKKYGLDEISEKQCYL